MRQSSVTSVDAARDVVVAPDRFAAPGRLAVPAGARGLVVFADGRGCTRSSRGNRFVARRLWAAGQATLLFDLLSEEEARDQANARDIELLGVRLLAATRWVRRQPSCAGLQVGYFGAGTDAAVALLAAAEDPTVGAVVSSSGRTDLVGAALTAVFASTLLIVGDADPSAVAINEEASRRLRSAHRLVVVPGATHFLEEPGVLDAVAGYATTWFADHLGGAPQDLGR